jgi:hypothetical protein
MFGATSSLHLARIIGGTPASNEGNEGRGREEGRRIKAGLVRNNHSSLRLYDDTPVG